MLEPKAVVRFALVAVVIYAALTWLWPKMDRAYASWFRTVGNAFLARLWFWPEGSVRFLDLHADDLREQVNATLPADLPEGFALPKAADVRDTLLVLRNRDTPGKFGLLRTSSRIMGFTPTAVMAALALATPVSLWRRLGVLIGGLAVVHLFVLFRVTVLVINNGFAADKPYAIFAPGPFWRDVLRRGDEVLCDNPTFSYLVPVFLWLAVLVAVQLWIRPGRKSVAHGPGGAA